MPHQTVKTVKEATKFTGSPARKTANPHWIVAPVASDGPLTRTPGLVLHCGSKSAVKILNEAPPAPPGAKPTK